MTSDIYPTAPDDVSGRPSRKGGFTHDRLDPGPYRTGSGWRRPAAAAGRLQPGIPAADRLRAVLRHGAALDPAAIRHPAAVRHAAALWDTPALRGPAALWHPVLLHAGPGSSSAAGRPGLLASPADDPAAGRCVRRAADSAGTAATHHATGCAAAARVAVAVRVRFLRADRDDSSGRGAAFQSGGTT